MALMDHVLKAGKDILLAGLKKHLLTAAKNRWLERQESDYEQKISERMRNLDIKREEAVKQVGEFVADKEKAQKYALTDIEMGIGRRLEGAIACYGVGKQMECVRHIMLALDSIACILDWKDASKYLNEQNTVLFEKIKR